MIRQGNKIVLGMRQCANCWGKGTMPTYGKCKPCKGTGKGPRGGRNGCHSCSGSRRSYDYDDMKTCETCKGNPEPANGGGIPEGWTDYLPDGVLQSLPFKLYRDYCQPFTESIIGIGTLWAVGDYGALASRTDDDKIIEDVRNSSCGRGIQACALVDNDGELCDHVGIFVGSNGYSVKAVRAVSVKVPVEV